MRMQIIETLLEFEEGQSLESELAKMLDYPYMKTQFRNIITARFSKSSCMQHGLNVTVENMDAKSFTIKTCCKTQQEVTEKFVNCVRQDFSKISLILVVIHQKLGCDFFDRHMQKCEKITTTDPAEFVDSMMDIFLNIDVLDRIKDDVFTKAAEDLKDTLKSIMH